MIRSAGIGSGLDVNGIITQLMNVERIPLKKLQASESDVNAQISTYGQLKNLMSDFETEINNLRDLGSKNFYSSTVSDSNRLNVSLDNSNVSLGSHTISINKLASAHKIGSDGFAAANTSIGATGTLEIQVGTESFQINIDSSNNTLEGIKNAINNSNNNKGVQASIMRANNGGSENFYLILTAKNTGANSAISLQDVSGNVASTLNVTNQIKPAQNAEITIDGFNMSRASNVINDAIQGVTLTLKSETTDPITLNINNDNDAKITNAKDTFQKFVDKFNQIIGFLDEKRVAGSDNDSTFLLIKRQIRNVVENAASSVSAFKNLSELGITTSKSERLTAKNGVEYVVNGKLSIDSSRLDSVLKSNFDAVLNTLNNSTDGYITRLAQAVKDINKFGGIISQRNDSLNSRENYLEGRIAKEEARLTLTEQAYQKQYANLDRIMSQFNSTSSYLANQFEQLLASNQDKK